MGKKDSNTPAPAGESSRSKKKTTEPYWLPITPEQGVGLVERLLSHDEDEEAAALVALLYYLTWENDWQKREAFTEEAISRAYSLTVAFSRSEGRFIAESMLRATGHPLVNQQKGGKR